MWMTDLYYRSFKKVSVTKTENQNVRGPVLGTTRHARVHVVNPSVPQTRDFRRSEESYNTQGRMFARHGCQSHTSRRRRCSTAGLHVPSPCSSVRPATSCLVLLLLPLLLHPFAFWGAWDRSPQSLPQPAEPG